MKCPYCGYKEDKVIDSRTTKEGHAIRRRRECVKCEKRFTTYEQIEDILPMVVKKDGRRELFDRNKIIKGIRRACEKRPVSMADIERIAAEIEKNIIDRGEREVSSVDIGEFIMKSLNSLDHVAYVRFASVYREFKDIGDFMSEVKKILSSPR